MNDVIKYEIIESKIIDLKGQKVILDSDVAQLYGVETKRVNEAIKNNPDKFPVGYIIQVSKEEWKVIKSKFSTLETKGKGKHTKYTPKAFTEKGLYMLATILKSKTATETTLAIIETFAKVRELTKTIKILSENPEKEKQKPLMQKSGEIISELLDDGLKVNESETTIELNFAVLKFKHTVKKK
ncbi:MAG: ORF6N domain-containing protein [Chlamydiae bacterium]|nr:MAG: ORF6N domain-containing protein [Chlamydiota bacterium]